MKKFLCWLFCHNWKWVFHDDKPSSLLCRRCGQEQENGYAYLLKLLLKVRNS